MPSQTQWIEAIQPSATELEELVKKWGIHPLAVEDCINRNQRSKFEDFEVHQFMVVHGATESAVIEFHFVIRPDAIILITTAAPPTSASWREYFQLPTEGGDAAHLLYQALDRIVDLTEATTRGFYERLSKLESQIFSRSMEPRALLRLKHYVAKVTQNMAALPSVIKQWMDYSKPSGDLRWRLRDVWDHSERLRQSLELFQQQTAAALDIYWGWTSKLANDQMERLTALAAVFMPLTFWTGFFGMNFQLMPYSSLWFFILGMAGMVSSVTAFYFTLRRSGYFGGRKTKH